MKPEWTITDMEDNSEFTVGVREDAPDYAIAICESTVEYPHALDWDMNDHFGESSEVFVLMKYPPLDAETEERPGPPEFIKEFTNYDKAKEYANGLIAKEQAAEKAQDREK